jgi:hypothetical protein
MSLRQVIHLAPCDAFLYIQESVTRRGLSWKCVTMVRVLQPGDRHALRGPWRYKDYVNLPLRGHCTDCSMASVLDSSRSPSTF